MAEKVDVSSAGPVLLSIEALIESEDWLEVSSDDAAAAAAAAASVVRLDELPPGAKTNSAEPIFLRIGGADEEVEPDAELELEVGGGGAVVAAEGPEVEMADEAVPLFDEEEEGPEVEMLVVCTGDAGTGALVKPEEGASIVALTLAESSDRADELPGLPRAAAVVTNTVRCPTSE